MKIKDLAVTKYVFENYNKTQNSKKWNNKRTIKSKRKIHGRNMKIKTGLAA